jgi:SAM-dependent methyltransferase
LGRLAVRREVRTTADLASAYDAWHLDHSPTSVDPRQREFFNWVLDLVKPAPGGRLLDVACGNGAFLSVAAERRLALSGIDVAPVAIDVARALVPQAELRVGNAEDLPYEDSSFDVVTCLGSLEHFPEPARGAAELARVLRPTGTAIVFVPNLFFLGHVWFGLLRGTQPSEGGQDFSETFRSSQGWIDLLEGCGLSVVRWEVWNHIYASQKVSDRTKRLWNLVARVIPRNGAYAFAFVCRAPTV